MAHPLATRIKEGGKVGSSIYRTVLRMPSASEEKKKRGGRS